MKLNKWAGAAALGLAVVGAPAEASVVIDVSEVGGNVVATGSGSIDLSDLTPFATAGGTAFMNPGFGNMDIGGASGAYQDITEYNGVSGPTSFGADVATFASSSFGDIFGVNAKGPNGTGVDVPFNYVSGTALSGSATFDGQTFASLGLTPGTYAYAWGSGPTADSLTVKIGAAATPEPGTWAMMLIGFAALGLAGFRATRRSAARAT
jgi:PEP-CTERM motif